MQALPTAKLYEMGLKLPYTLLKERTRWGRDYRVS